MCPLGGPRPGNFPEGPLPAEEQESQESFRRGKFVNIFFSTGLVICCLAIAVYLVMKGQITFMMGFLAFSLPCFIVLASMWTKSDTKFHKEHAMHKGRGIRSSDLQIFFEIPIKLLDMMMGDDGIEQTFIFFVVPFSLLIGLFKMYPDPSSYPAPIDRLIRMQWADVAKLLTRHKRRRY